MNSRKSTIAIIAALVLIATVSCAKEQKTVQTAEVKATPVETVIAQNGTITQYHKFSGTVTANDTVPVLPGNTGKVSSLDIKVGDRVSKDQVLAYVDPSRDGQKYNPSPVKAPVDGTVTSLNASVGAMVSPQSAFAIIEDLDNLHISFSVMERYATKVKKGTKANITFEAFPGEVFTATVTEVSPTMDVMTRTLKAKAVLDTEDPGLIAGMFAAMNVVLDSCDDTVILPYSALIVSSDGTSAFVVDSASGESHVRKVSVQTGMKEGNSIQIISGVKAGDAVVLKGQNLLSDGDAVKAVN